jgi:Glycosyltransferase family 87
MYRIDLSEADLVTRRSLLCGVVAAILAAWYQAANVAAHGPSGLYNDFYLYWGGIKLLGAGHDPYDVAAMGPILQQAGLHPATGMGYTYPLLLAYLMLPLSLLPPFEAGLLFSFISLAGLVLAVALLLAPLSRLPWWELGLLVVGVATFAAVDGTLHFGQANLLVLPLLALAFRGAARSCSLALASAVKLYPVAGLLAFLPRIRQEWRWLALGGGAFVALSVIPNLLGGGHSPHLGEMFTPDAYWTDESINGFVSRLAGARWHTAPPLIPGLPVEPTMVALAALLGMAALAVVLVVRGRPWDGCLALLLAYATVAAPRNSLWNFLPVLVPMAWCWPRVRRRPLLLAILLAGWGLIQLQLQVYSDGGALQQTALLGLLGSVALYGGLVVAGLTAYLLLENRDEPA